MSFQSPFPKDMKEDKQSLRLSLKQSLLLRSKKYFKLNLDSEGTIFKNVSNQPQERQTILVKVLWLVRRKRGAESTK